MSLSLPCRCNLIAISLQSHCNLIAISLRRLYGRSRLDKRNTPNYGEPLWQKKRCPSEYANGSLRSLIYIYIYIYNPLEIYIYIYILKKFLRAPPYEIISGKNRGGGPFSYSGTEPKSGMIQVYWSSPRVPRGKIGHMEIKI